MIRFNICDIIVANALAGNGSISGRGEIK